MGIIATASQWGFPETFRQRITVLILSVECSGKTIAFLGLWRLLMAAGGWLLAAGNRQSLTAISQQPTANASPDFGMFP
jgi:hypothetical protein